MNWLGVMNVRNPAMAPIATFRDRYLGSTVNLLAEGDGWVIVQHPWRGHVRKQRAAHFKSPRYVKLTP